MEILKLVDAMNKAGFDRAWARVMRALAIQDHVQILGAGLSEDPVLPEPVVDDPLREQSTRRPPNWLNSWGETIPRNAEGEEVHPLSLRPFSVTHN